MTDTTDIAALREICGFLNEHGYDPGGDGEEVNVNNVAKTVRMILQQHCESSKELEAERQRADANAQEIRRLEFQWEHRAPTQWAYDQACTALHAQRERAEKAEASVGVLEGIIARKEFDALKGDQVPYGYYSAETATILDQQGHANITKTPGGNWQFPLFAAPQKPVELLNKITQADAPELAEISAQVERLGLKGAYGAYAAGWNAAIDKAIEKLSNL